MERKSKALALCKSGGHDEGFDSMGYEWVTRLLKTGPWIHGLSSRSRTDNQTGLRSPD